MAANQQKAVSDFLQTKGPIAQLIREPSALGYRRLLLSGYKAGFFSSKDVFVHLWPARFSFGMKKKYLRRYDEFMERQIHVELSEYLSPDGDLNLLGRPFRARQYVGAIKLIDQVVARDQYHARKFIRDGFTIIDAGANIGTFSVLAATLAPNGEVFAFEPAGGTFPLLERNASPYQNIHCFNAGLADHAGEKEIFDTGLGGTASVISDSPIYASATKHVEGAIETVLVTTIDNFVEENGIARLDFLKIDTEGYEAKILRGGQATIKRYRPVIAMSAYHAPNDKAELPNLLRSICSDYVCELSNGAEEDLICFATGQD